MNKADITIKQIETPINNWCCSGHEAPLMFKRDGAESESEPTRFFLISGKSISGIYCEPCLIVANYVANQKRKNNGT